MKQTAVEWLIENVIISAPLNWDTTIVEQAKEMEKEQIIDSWENGFREFYDGSSTPEQYYKNTYEKD